ncbi:MAG: HAMP domain-containing protein [Clostridiales bacterium]|nr:HAMP domain-containing protein [Candidatus Blautia equi]
MRKHLLMEFLLVYIFLGVLGFFTVTGLGSYLIESYLENNIARDLNLEADSLAENQHLLDAFNKRDWPLLEEDLRTLANYEDATIWIIDEKNEIVVSVPDTPLKSISDRFHPQDWINDAHTTGTFFDSFSDQRLSVVSPLVLDEKGIDAYVVIHYQMERLHIRRAGALLITQILFVVMYLFSFILVAFYYLRVHRPLEKITEGARNYAKGNLSYRIPVNSFDEMGYLAGTLNYMSDILNQNGEYQKEFVSNVSHDFRSPLTSIKGYVNAILDGTIPPEYQEKYLHIISSETERLEKLTKSLLVLNDLDIKKRTLQKARMDINRVIRETTAVFEGTYKEKDIIVDVRLPERETMVMADEQQIKQVLYNLLDNAIKFSPSGSSITIEVKKRGSKVFVSIEDQGCGIPKDSLPKIWTRFYKTDTSRGKDRHGTGLGLSIVKEIINAHDQQIDVISTEGVGTEFIFTLEKA